MQINLLNPVPLGQYIHTVKSKNKPVTTLKGLSLSLNDPRGASLCRQS